MTAVTPPGSERRKIEIWSAGELGGVRLLGLKGSQPDESQQWKHMLKQTRPNVRSRVSDWAELYYPLGSDENKKR